MNTTTSGLLQSLFLLSWLVVGAVHAQPEPLTTAIAGVTVIDAQFGLREDQTVLFRGDEILAVVPATETVEADTVIDGSGRFLIPGLWDFHVHLTYDERLTEAMPDLFLSWGITSVRDTGGLLDEILPVVRSMRQPGAIAPRVFFAGPLLDGEFVVYDGDGRPEIGLSAPTPAAARAAVQALHEQGVDFIKVYEMVTPEVFAALVATARELGLPIDSHVPLALRARSAGAQVDSIEHLRNIEMDCAGEAETLHRERQRRLLNDGNLSGAALRASLHNLQRLPAVRDFDAGECATVIAALQNTVMVPTLRLNSFNLVPAYEREDWAQALMRLPESVREEWSAQGEDRARQEPGDIEFAEWSLFLTELMHRASVPFGAGTDVPINLSIPGYSLHSELEMLVMAGLSPLEALAAATLIPARYFGLEDSMGAIAPGRVADLVLLTANPLEDITNSKSIAAVYSKGVRIEP